MGSKRPFIYCGDDLRDGALVETYQLPESLKGLLGYVWDVLVDAGEQTTRMGGVCQDQSGQG